MKPSGKILASIIIVVLALSVLEIFAPTVAWTDDTGTMIGFDSAEQQLQFKYLFNGKPWGGIGINGTIRFWNGTVGTHQGGLQKWPMYWFITIRVKIGNETFRGGCLVIEDWEEHYGWREIAVRDAKAHGMNIIVVNFNDLKAICYQIDLYFLTHSYLSKPYLAPSMKQWALNYFNEIWQTNLMM